MDDQEDWRNDEYWLDLQCAYRGWLAGWTEEWTARYYAVHFAFVLNVYAALNKRWPGMAKRRLRDPQGAVQLPPCERLSG